MSGRWLLCRVLMGLLLLWPGTAAGTASQASLLTVEGQVETVEVQPGEGGIDVLSLRLKDADDGREREILLAPADALQEIGFEVEKGDRIRARIFIDSDGPAKTHKILNLSRSTMIRLRTLHRVPLWNSSGTWQGGACRQSPSAGGHRRRGGGGSPR